MTVTIEEMIKDHIIILSITQPIVFPDDVETPLSASVGFKQKVGAPIWRIMDFSHSDLQFGQMVMGLGGELNQPGGFWDPDVNNIIIGTNEWVKFGVDSIQKQQQYQGANIKGLVATREEALKIARSL